MAAEAVKSFAKQGPVDHASFSKRLLSSLWHTDLNEPASVGWNCTRQLKSACLTAPSASE